MLEIGATWYLVRDMLCNANMILSHSCLTLLIGYLQNNISLYQWSFGVFGRIVTPNFGRMLIHYHLSWLGMLIKELLNKWWFMKKARKLGQTPHMTDACTNPPTTTLKCNVDCILLHNSSITWYGIYFRDSVGEPTLVILESDSKIVVDNVNYDLVSHNELGDIIHRCKDLLSTRNGYVVRHVRRQASRVAITRASLSNHSPCIFNDVPDYLYS